MARVERFEVRPITTEELESHLQELGEHVETVFNVEDAQREFDELMRVLEEKRSKMRETIRTLDKTKDTLKEELKNREEEVEDLNTAISELENEKRAAEQSIKESQEKLDKTLAEKGKISVLMGSLKVAIEDMRRKLAEL
ncbi:TPA: hypothetical protein H1005_01775 [archaeon]|uniref:Uncharacterized protein n=1 Tax=Candidatus Naiadarchaeum limnaeum TaxID=2756139 RepID=A0A832XJ95_9ARCH|nr:hypothetical protein [Candidatus Naiadarchaeales archaeon SRR2090153.bin1042]HIK00277.1 hypothetical protein [Candidatus Naiadarchaeum limnaeum]